VAGAVAGMTAVFGTPIAALLLAVELLLFELRPRSLAPVAVACAVAGFLRPLLIESGPLFPLHTHGAAAVGAAVLPDRRPAVRRALGVVRLPCTVSKTRFHKLPVHWMWWPAIGGLAVGIGGYLQPRALGVGYDVIGDLLNNHLAAGAIASLLIVKAVIWLLALGSGTSGGVLAPLLMLGAGLGALLGPYLPGGDPAAWPLVFMAATLGGMMRAPVMAVVFAFELTHDVNSLLPVLATSTVAYAFTVITMHRSILTEKIARRGHHIYREYGIDPMERHSVAEVMTATTSSIDAQALITDVLASHFGPDQRHRAFPVVRDGALVGMLDRAGIETARAPPVRCRSATCTASTCRSSRWPTKPAAHWRRGWRCMNWNVCRWSATRLADQIEDLLPQTQCTKCGYPACRPYAEAIAAARPTSTAARRAAWKASRAVVGDGPRPSSRSIPPTAWSARARSPSSTNLCIGCTLCIQACPVDAILGAAKQMHTILPSLCTGCDLCVAPCPVDCIAMYPVTTESAPAGTPGRSPQADAARARHDFRTERLQREKEENDARLAAKAVEKMRAVTAKKPIRRRAGREGAQARHHRRRHRARALAPAEGKKEDGKPRMNPAKRYEIFTRFRAANPIRPPNSNTARRSNC
jgi:RnfABCDGE-type electron transport complex B subunit